MAERNPNGPRLVTARRVSALTGLAALAAAGVISSSEAQAEGESAADESLILAQSEGEGEASASAEGDGAASVGGEGEAEGGASADPDTAFLSGLAFMEGHIRAGLALYEQGDLQAAKTHMGHPIEEKYDAVAERLAETGFDTLKEQISALAAATEAEAEYAEIEQQYAAMRETLEAVREGFSPAQQVAGLIDLTRVAGEEYTVAVEGGQLSNLHEYQDSWGFLRVVETEAREMANSEDALVAEVGRSLLEQVEATGAAFGDLQGEGAFEMDPSIIYGAAARMDLASSQLARAEGESAASGESEEEGEASAEGEGEGEGESH
ncbi:hypothetical protein LX81_03595 [Palleronia aestuarii]|uniref:YfdX protein n=1 Tax=Palleronia aestuarii TaxID=568105 RepID=A0A2W7MY00_9RHOB|nr:hypothetical protein [Palleronia aestuarii]PZX12491.1 hypothetical protein LX81_03595 [Palleronia aestuarii]